MKKVTFLLSEDLHKRLKLRAVEEQTTVTDLITRAATELLGKAPVPPDERKQAPEEDNRPLADKIMDRIIERDKKKDMPFDPF